MRIAIIVSRFNESVSSRLLDGALEALYRNGAAENCVEVCKVPGAWELPIIARRLAATGRYDAIVALGCVIRGETAHFEHVSRGAVDGLARVQLDTGIPIVLGVLSPENMAQAMARSGGEVGHAGVRAAEAALEMASLRGRLSVD